MYRFNKKQFENGAVDTDFLTNCEKDLILWNKLSKSTQDYLISEKKLNFFDSEAAEHIYSNV